MTKKDYIALSEVVNKTFPKPDADKIKLVENLIEVLQLDNPNFNELTFVRACGLQD